MAIDFAGRIRISIAQISSHRSKFAVGSGNDRSAQICCSNSVCSPKIASIGLTTLL